MIAFRGRVYDGPRKGKHATMNPQPPLSGAQVARALREALDAMQAALEGLRRAGDARKGSEMLALLEHQLALLGQLADRCGPARAPATASARRVLVVDDNVDTAEALVERLERMGHEVFVAYTGARALEMAHERRPDVVFLDLALPDVSGFDIARGMRKDAGLDAARIVALTGFGSDEHRRRAAESGIDDYLVKPISAEMLMELLGKLG